MDRKSWFSNSPDWISQALTAAAFAVYFALSWRYAHGQSSVLDEGMYLYKGWLFATGQFTPYQDFGPWTNHMPLSYLVPGWVQLLFGAGLRTGRLLAIATGMLSLLGTWVLARRFGGRWWGAAAAWAIALNPAMIKIFSIQASQGLAACILVWTLVFTLGKGRPTAALAAGGLAAAALALTRINLFPVFPFLAVYIFLVHGRRATWIFAGSGLLGLLIGHAAFWPGILRLWTPWLPETLTPFLDVFRRPPNEGSLWDPAVGLQSRILSFVQGLRFHFLAALGLIAALFIRPAPEAGPDRPRRLTTVFLAALLLLLLGMHAWASLGQSYCVFCFPVYLSFFMAPALVLFPLVFSGRAEFLGPGRMFPAAVIFIGAAIGYGSAGTVGPALLGQPAVVQLLKINVPRTSGGGTIPLWGLLENLSGAPYEDIVRSGLLTGRTALAVMIGLSAALAVLFIARRIAPGGPAFPQRAFAVLAAAGLLFSPTAFLGGGYRTYDCGGDVIAAYESAGAVIAGFLPEEATVYWGTGESPAVLLELPAMRIFPAQLNGAYSYKFGGDPDALARFGHWNQALAQAWAGEADVLLLDAGAFAGPDGEWLAGLAESDFVRAGETGPVHPCDPGSVIRIFVRQ